MIDNPHRRQKKYVNEVKDYITIAIAMIIGSVGWVVFLLPNKITTGGVAGIASIVYWGTGIPVQIPYFAINALLLLAALKVLGWKFCVKTIYAVTVFTLAVSVLQQLTEGVHLLADQPFMATIAGGCFLGISVGLGLCCNGSTGGSDVVAAIVNKYRDISLGHAILLCDMAIVTSSYFVLKDWEQVIYGYVVLVIVSICVDRVVNSMRSSIQLFIISEKPLDPVLRKSRDNITGGFFGEGGLQVDDPGDVLLCLKDPVCKVDLTDPFGLNYLLNSFGSNRVNLRLFSTHFQSLSFLILTIIKLIKCGLKLTFYL